MSVLLIRHADAGDRAQWDGDDRLRPLSARGARQAALLPAVLSELRPARILSSPYLRCMETVEPLAQAAGVRVEREAELAEGGDGELVLRSPVLHAYCTHGDVCDRVLGALFRLGLVDRTARAQKGSTWVLEMRDGRPVAARYIAPPG